MEYQVLTPQDPAYPARLKERLGSEAPERLYYRGPLNLLQRFTMAAISADYSPGTALWASNQLFFTIRDYEINYIGGHHSVIEMEIFRLGLYFPHTSVSLFTARGLGKETFESFLLTRFSPPMHEFPERKEYFRRAEEGELLMLSITDPQEGGMTGKNIRLRNWIACNLADVVYVPGAIKGSKTLPMAKRVFKAGIPIFTTDHESNIYLHKIGIPAYTRKTVGKYLETLSAHLAPPPSKEVTYLNLEPSPPPPPRLIQRPLPFPKGSRLR